MGGQRRGVVAVCAVSCMKALASSVPCWWGVRQVMVAVQESVYEYEGSINKFLMDDKGSTLVAVHGLPPVGHADDPTRGVLAALR